MSLKGIVSKRADAAYAPGNRGRWLKVKSLNREEFVVISRKDAEGSRPFLGPAARLLRSGRKAGLCQPRGQRHQYCRHAPAATPWFLPRCVVAPSRPAGYQNRQFKPKLNTVAPVSYEPIKMPADGLAE
jgi:hypothetical protein